ncbi:MAG: hypothetical protein GX434_00390 [Peptococcaceae bacterium]|nr:hypothetical protein [Peptococcaceae bacterium]
MFDLEGTAHRITDYLVKDVHLNTSESAKIEYGLSLFMGIAIELVLTTSISALFGTAFDTFLIMVSALFLRVFTGGAHCSSYRRCLVFTLVIFIGLSFPVKVLAAHTGYTCIVPVIAGLALQAFMASPIGQKIILGSDRIMQRFGI